MPHKVTELQHQLKSTVHSFNRLSTQSQSYLVKEKLQPSSQTIQHYQRERCLCLAYSITNQSSQFSLTQRCFPWQSLSLLWLESSFSSILLYMWITVLHQPCIELSIQRISLHQTWRHQRLQSQIKARDVLSCCSWANTPISLWRDTTSNFSYHFWCC